MKSRILKGACGVFAVTSFLVSTTLGIGTASAGTTFSTAISTPGASVPIAICAAGQCSPRAVPSTTNTVDLTVVSDATLPSVQTTSLGPGSAECGGPDGGSTGGFLFTFHGATADLGVTLSVNGDPLVSESVPVQEETTPLFAVCFF